MSTSDQMFSVLSLCARPLQGRTAGAAPLGELTGSLSEWDALIDTAEQHGMDTLLLAHLRDQGVGIPPRARERLHARWTQQAHACAVRTRVIADLVATLDAAGAPSLLLKGAALATLVYDDPRHRPMRDVDVLIRPGDAARAYAALRREGFVETRGDMSPSYHHLPGLRKEVDGVTITVELHVRLLRDTALLPGVDYDALAPRAQSCDVLARRCRTLGREDLLWHVYAHAFAINVLCPAIRLISLADLIHATERWVGSLEWDRVRREYPRLFVALILIDEVVPWSPVVRERLGIPVGAPAVPRPIRPLSRSGAGTSAEVWRRDVWWPAEWWCRMRYGIPKPTSLFWFRAIGHPLRVVLAGLDTAGGRLAKRWRPRRRHHLLRHSSH